jgi:hypothetical protein
LKTIAEKKTKKVTIMTPSTVAAAEVTKRGAKKVEVIDEETTTKRQTRKRK